MIHYVIAEVDRGEPIVVQQVEIRKTDSLDDLKQRIRAKEHKAIVKGTNIALQRLGDT
jgi:phosphoribosylglycinamide formyltransferase